MYETPSPLVLDQSSSAPQWWFLMTWRPQIKCDSQRKEKSTEEITSDLNVWRDGCARRCSEPNPGREADKRRVLGEIWTRAVDGVSPSWWCHPVRKRIYSPQGGCRDITRDNGWMEALRAPPLPFIVILLCPAHPPTPPPPPTPRLISQGSSVTCILMSPSDIPPSPRQLNPCLGQRLITVYIVSYIGKCLVWEKENNTTSTPKKRKQCKIKASRWLESPQDNTILSGNYFPNVYHLQVG